MENKEELIVEEFIKEENKVYTFQRDGYDFIRVNSPIPKEAVSLKWLFIPLVFFLTFLGLGFYGYVMEILGEEISGRLLAIMGFSLLGFLFSFVGFFLWKDFKEDKEEKRHPPKVEFSLVIPLKKPHNCNFESGDKIEFIWRIVRDSKEVGK